MKRVLHVVGGMNIGGTETMLMNLYRNIDKRKLQFDFISYYSEEGHYDREIINLGGKVINLPAPNMVGPWKAIKDLCRVIKENGPYEVIHCHTLFNCGLATLAGFLCGVKIRISHAHTTSDSKNSIIKRIYIFIMRLLISLFSTDYIACSNSAAQYLFGKKSIKKSKYSYLPNYIDYYRFCRESKNTDMRKELGIKADEKVVGHIGRFIDAKNHSFLVQVIANMIKKNPKIRVLLVGDGVLKKDIELQVKSLGLEDKVIFTGEREDISELLGCMDIFIFPSIYEGLGIALLEAQAAGLPCLVSEAIQSEADIGIGLLKKVELSSGVEVWAEIAMEMIDSKPLDFEVIIQGFERRGYDFESTIHKLYEIYNMKNMESYHEKCTDIIF